MFLMKDSALVKEAVGGWWHWWWHRIITRTNIVCYSKAIIQPLRTSQMLFSFLIISRTISTNPLARLLIDRLLAQHSVFDNIGPEAQRHRVIELKEYL
jgi:hypothetical protein